MIGRLLRWVALMALISAGTYAVVRLGFEHDTPAAPVAASARSSEARDALCSATASARNGDPATAGTIFMGRTHDHLHRLAADTAERSRPAAARLLEAKAKVEAGLQPFAPTLPDDLEALATATGEAMAAAGGIDPGPCPR